jgi:membrane-bound lytic murein transglycosylase B
MSPAPGIDRRRRLIGIALAVGWIGAGRAAPASPAAVVPYWSRPAVREFADEAASRLELPLPWVQAAITSGRHSEAAARWMSTTSPAPQDWRRFRQGQIDDHQLARGLSFWWKYQDALDQAQVRFGTTAEVIVAIIGIESRYGRVTGRFRTLDVLLTLGFDLARRADEYREELAQFLKLCAEQAAEPTSVHGSIAGAIGMPQFLPSSIRRYAVDFDQDGSIDLARSARDAIGSVAHFLAEHGWRAGLPVMLRVDLPGQAGTDPVDTEGSWSRLQQLGMVSNDGLDPDERVRLIGLRFQDERGSTRQDLRAGTANFEALLGYNRSYFYAATVAELAQELRRRFDGDAALPYSASG